MTVYVGIVTYNSRADLPACFAALRAQICPAPAITVLDNASLDGSADWVRIQAPQARLIQSAANLGFGRGHNRILAALDLKPGDFYLTLNPDVVLSPGYIAALVEIIGETGADWATGKLVQPSPPARERGLQSTESQLDRRFSAGAGQRVLYSVGHGLCRNGYAINIGYGLPDRGQFDTPREVFGAPGAAALLRAELIAAVAPDGELFDADMFLYGEDTDLDWRARRLGLRCWYAPNALAQHRGSNPPDALRAQATANRYLSAIKNACWLDLIACNLPLIVAHCLARTALTPRFGLALATRIVRLAPRMIRKRRKPRVPRAVMLRWFRWSREQPTAQPITLRSRLVDALQRRFFRKVNPTAPAVSPPPLHEAEVGRASEAFVPLLYEVERGPGGEVPPSLNVLGVNVGALNMGLTLDAIEGWIARREQHYVCVTNTHSIMACRRDPDLRRIFNAAGLVTPDGMPLVWLCRIAGLRHVRRVYGPDLLLALCERSAVAGHSHFFYGGRPGIPEQLAAQLRACFPGLRVAGVYSPPLRAFTAAEDAADVARINASGADVVWIALGTGKQERWMAEHIGRLSAPALIGVGAAFDFLTGARPQAPRWMRENGFEWLFRLVTEPRRLWRRYLIDAPLFVALVALQKMGLRRF